jgi:hypothetical protein
MSTIATHGAIRLFNPMAAGDAHPADFAYL